MELRVPHVTSYARAPSSLLFLRSAHYQQMPRFLQFLREFWPMPLPLMIHSALALFAHCTRIPTSARSIGFCVIWVCIRLSSSSNSIVHWCHKCRMPSNRRLQSWPWPVFRLKWTKFRFVFRSKKAQISLLISFHKKKIRTFRIV